MRLAHPFLALFDRPAAFADAFDNEPAIFLRPGDQFGNRRGGYSRLFGQLADFAGDHGKAAAQFTDPCRFNGGIQRQQNRSSIVKTTWRWFT